MPNNRRETITLEILGRPIRNMRRMPKIYPIRSGPYAYKLEYRPSDTHRFYRADQARQLLRDYDALCATLLLHGTAGLQMDAKARAEYMAASDLLAPLGVSVLDAARDYAGRHANLAADITLEEARDLWLRHKLQLRVARRTYDTHEDRVNALIGSTAAKTVRQLSRSHIVAWLASRDICARTWVNDMATVSQWLAWLVGQGYLAESPASGIERPILEPPAPRTLTLAQATALLRAASVYQDGWRINPPGYMAPYFATGILAGLRPSEIEGLMPGDVIRSDSHQLLKVYRGKMRRRAARNVPLEPALAAWLDAYPVPQIHPRRCWRSAFDAIRESAGVRSIWQGDIMRHTYASWQLELHGLQETARRMGDKTSTVQRYYTNVADHASLAGFAGLTPAAVLAHKQID